MKRRKKPAIRDYMQVFMPPCRWRDGKYIPPSREEVVDCIVKYANQCREMDREFDPRTVYLMIWPEHLDNEVA